jgi:uncharacterized membrane protein
MASGGNDKTHGGHHIGRNHCVHETPAQGRWLALLSSLTVGGLYSLLPERLSIGPNWLLPAVVGVLAVPIVIAHHSGKHSLNQWLSYLGLATETAALVASVTLLVLLLPAHRAAPVVLLRSAGALWLINVLIFALWYWRLDAGGPYYRELRTAHKRGAFWFPQMALPEDDGNRDPRWTPHFVDYLFLAFNTSTALSPTDSPVLARWAKVLMMLQSLISLTIIAVLASRAVNIL